jgi:hypothetical protein
MNPVIIAAIITLVEKLIENEPAIAAELQNIFSNPNPTPADWQALRAKVLGESFDQLCPDAKTGA